MKTAAWWKLAAGAACLAWGAGCASTPASRIEKNPDLFNELDPAVQAAVQEGHIDVGFPPEAVRLALGKPSRVYERTSDAGASSIWSYVDYDVYYRPEPVHYNYPVRTRDGGVRYVYTTDWIDVRHTRAEERLRVEFRNGVVHSIERVTER